MKKLLISALLLPMVAVAQNPFAEVMLPLGCDSFDLHGREVNVLYNDSHMLVGTAIHNDTLRPFSMGIDEYGFNVYTKLYSEGYFVEDMFVDRDSRMVYIAGRNEEQDPNENYLLKVDFDGTLQWEHTYDPGYGTRCANQRVDVVNGRVYYHTSFVDHGPTTYDNIVALKINSNGALLRDTIHCTDPACDRDDQVYDQEYWRGDTIVKVGYIGNTEGGSPIQRGFILLQDTNLGAIQYYMENTGNYLLRAVHVHSSGNIVVAGAHKTSGWTIVSMYDPSLNEVWSTRFQVDNTAVKVDDIIAGGGSNIIINGELDGATTSEEIVLAMFNSSGTLLGAKRHIPTSVTAYRYYGSDDDGNVIGFADVDYTHGNYNLSTVEVFNSSFSDTLCIFNVPDINSEPVSNPLDADEQILEDITHEVGELGVERAPDFVDKPICHPCTSKEASKPAISPGVGIHDEDVNDYLESPSNVEGTESPADIRIYPNPNDGRYAIDWLNGDGLTHTIQLYAVDGSLVWSGTAVAKGRSNFDVDLRPGAYMLSIDGSNAETLIVK